MGTDGMQAWLWEKYGPPEALRLAEVAKPRPASHEVLVRVRAVSINAADWHAMRGKPAFARLTYGLVRPKRQSLGVDIAGIRSSVTDTTQPRPKSSNNRTDREVSRTKTHFPGLDRSPPVTY